VRERKTGCQQTNVPASRKACFEPLKSSIEVKSVTIETPSVFDSAVEAE
jgi:hypothetical protein